MISLGFRGLNFSKFEVSFRSPETVLDAATGLRDLPLLKGMSGHTGDPSMIEEASTWESAVLEAKRRDKAKSCLISRLLGNTPVLSNAATRVHGMADPVKIMTFMI